LTKDKIFDFENWFKKPIQVKAKQMREPFSVETLEGMMKGNAGDYLIMGIESEMYPCKKSVFEKTYSKEQSVPVLVHEEALELIEEQKKSIEILRLYSSFDEPFKTKLKKAIKKIVKEDKQACYFMGEKPDAKQFFKHLMCELNLSKKAKQ